MLASGVLTYAFHVLRPLARAGGYGQIAVLWGAMFIAAIRFFRPLEQTTSRALADRLARGEERRQRPAPVAWIAAVALTLIGPRGSAFWARLATRSSVATPR